MPRKLQPGQGEAVAKRTIFRASDAQDWANVATRVALGNTLLHAPTGEFDFELARRHIGAFTLLMSGRHLQHGDVHQPSRALELFTNCAASAISFQKFRLMLNGSGVGRCYDRELLLADLCNLPRVFQVLSQDHPDWNDAVALGFAEAESCNPADFDLVIRVPDTREGWADAYRQLEVLAAEGAHRDTTVLIDWSDVRPKGSPIRGMQDRPAAGPVPTMEAFRNVCQLRDEQHPVWLQTMLADHYLAACVHVGGARRAARIALMHWKQPDVLQFIASKQKYDMWTANNSVVLDDEFYEALERKDDWALRVHTLRTHSAYFGSLDDGSAKGEPGFVNVHKLTKNTEGLEVYKTDEWMTTPVFQPDDRTKAYLRAVMDRVLAHGYLFIVNPCGEVVLFIGGAYCVIADTVPYLCDTDEEAEQVVRLAARMLMRTNLMPAMFQAEVHRTNRIGVAITGWHSWAYKRFGYGWKELIDEDASRPFWMLVSRLKRAVNDECERYAPQLGLPVPHTNTTVKPAGTTSKLIGIEEGAHGPKMYAYLRWVQYQNGDPLIAELQAKGYPTRGDLKSYPGVTLVGFPAQVEACKIIPLDKLVLAPDAPMEEHFEFIQLIEKYWIRGVDEHGEPLGEERGNQISYTMMYDPAKVSYQAFHALITEHGNTVRACSVLPHADTSAFEYLPEEELTPEQFIELVESIDDPDMRQDIDMEHLRCMSGACPI